MDCENLFHLAKSTGHVYEMFMRGKRLQKLKRERWRGGGGTKASQGSTVALTFRNVNRKLLAEKSCAITTKAS